MIRLFEGAAVAETYALARPKTPPRVAQTSMAYLAARNKPSANGKYELMVDVGCGGGQSTEIFAKHFNNILGIDPSAAQVNMARTQNKHKNIAYQEGSGENIPVATETVDLITCGQSAHWLNLTAFFEECRRALKPNGCLVIHGYGIPKLSLQYPHRFQNTEETVNQLLLGFHNTCTFHPRRRHVINQYREIFDSIYSSHKSRNDSVKIETKSTLQEFVAYLSTWSGYRSYMEEIKKQFSQQYQNQSVVDSLTKECDILTKFLKTLQREWNVETVALKDVMLKVTFDMFILTSERPIKT